MANGGPPEKRCCKVSGGSLKIGGERSVVVHLVHLKSTWYMTSGGPREEGWRMASVGPPKEGWCMIRPANIILMAKKSGKWLGGP